MPRRAKIPRMLEDITNISEDFLDIDQDDFDTKIRPADISEDQSEEEVCVSLVSNSEEENILNVRRPTGLLRMSSSSDENDR